MRKTMLGASGLVFVASAASAHPTGVPFQSRGDCEVTYEQSSKLDRERLVSLGIFDTYGAAQRTFNDLFACEYDPALDVWFIVFIGGTDAQTPKPGGQ